MSSLHIDGKELAGMRADSAVDISATNGAPTADKEVAAWVIDAMERRRDGTMGRKEKPPLHAVALDAVPSPKGESPGGAGPPCIAAGGD